MDLSPAEVPDLLGDTDGPVFLPDLARLELSCRQAEQVDVPDEMDQTMVNPSLHIVSSSWSGLNELVQNDAEQDPPLPGRDDQVLLVWKAPKTGQIKVLPASERDILALKVISENLDPVSTAREGGVPVGVVDGAIKQAEDKGLLIAPPSRLRRSASRRKNAGQTLETYLTAEAFTLQWHITQQCDLHCKHCYDRSSRSPLTLEQGLAVLDDMRSFCRKRRVDGQVTFTGGNPLLHPDFLELYRAAHERHLAVAVLGNPASRQTMEAIVAVTNPVYYQVSLEGLETHNDAIRGSGHFKRVMDFLDLLRDMGIFAQVMLTLTRDNMDQVLPLGDILRDKADSFTFNRLCPVGEGAALAATDPDQFKPFLKRYLEAARTNPVLQLKDNLFNILLDGCGGEVFGGCTGHGCGAAFNFVSLLSDGQVHACRKFDSPIGNLSRQTLEEVYDGAYARRYREGSRDCDGCALHGVCGTCLAVTAGLGLDPFTERDPYCFI